MEFFTPRKLKFKAWNTETHLMMRLNSLDNLRGEFIKKEHILLQFTSLYDGEGDEVYDMDILLHRSEKIIVYWSEHELGWRVSYFDKPSSSPMTDIKNIIVDSRKLGNYFELNRK